MIRICLAALLTLASSAISASAASSDWVETEGGSVRLVTTGVPDAEGTLTGMIDIVLKPGWKTYWRDPGDAGVPPTLDVSRSQNVSGAELAFPPPSRHDEGDFTWAGYGAPVAFPVTFRITDPAQPVVLDADLFLGICQTICIPVKAEFRLDPTDGADSTEDADAVTSAIAALPAPASAAFGASVSGRSGTMLTIAATVPGDPSAADIFLAGDGALIFGTPQRSVKDGRLEFTVEVEGLDEAPADTAIAYTLAAGGAAVDGKLQGPWK